MKALKLSEIGPVSPVVNPVIIPSESPECQSNTLRIPQLPKVPESPLTSPCEPRDPLGSLESLTPRDSDSPLRLKPSYNNTLEVATDSEWQGKGIHKEKYLSTQLSIKQPGGLLNIIFWHPLATLACPWEVLERETREAGAIALMIPMDSQGNPRPLADWLQENSEGVSEVILRIYYSPMDLWPFWSPEETSELTRRTWLSQKRRITLRADNFNFPVRSLSKPEGTRWFNSLKRCRNPRNRRESVGVLTT